MREEITDLMNSVFEKYQIDIQVEPNDIIVNNIPTQNSDYIQWSSKKVKDDSGKEKIIRNDKIANYLDKISQDRIGDKSTVYHLLKAEFAISTLQKEAIQLSSLAYLWKNDPLEYSEFLRRLGIYHLLVNNQIEKDKKDVFIFCFSDSCRNEESWNLYGRDETGVCLGFNFDKYQIQDKFKDMFFLRDVYYDNGYDFDFLTELQAKIQYKFQKRLIFGGISRFAKYYKRKKYNWEREIRLCFDFDENQYFKDTFKKLGSKIQPEIDLDNYFTRQYDKKADRQYIEVPFNNDFFQLEISEIICGKNIDKKHFEELAKIANSRDIKIWRRQ